MTVQQLLNATGIKSKRTLYKYIRFKAERLGKLEGKELTENGLELLKLNFVNIKTVNSSNYGEPTSKRRIILSNE